MESFKKRVSIRSAIISEIRRFFTRQGFLEVDTPVLHKAPIPEATIELFSSGPFFLQASPEYMMKRLVARGVYPVFQLARCFRKHESGPRHLQEFLLLEWYRPGNYYDLMADCELLFSHLRGATASIMQPHPHPKNNSGLFLRPDFSWLRPWPRLTVAEAFHRYTDLTPEQALNNGMFEELLTGAIEPHLGTTAPLFLMDYPVACASLAQKKKADPSLAERFELYIQGIELANGFSELTCPEEQQARFEKEHATLRHAGKKPPPMPKRFLKELADLPPLAGIALGVDRLVMLAAGCDSIADVVFLPPEP